MATRKFMGRGQLVNRLTAQVGDKDKAIAILQNRGQMDEHGKLTASGRKRDSMTAAERAVDRASRASGKPKTAYKYSASTNRATLKRR